MHTPSLERFLQQATDQRQPVWVEILADLDTPLSAYWKLAHDQEFSFLLESVTGGEQVGRYSFIGINPLDIFRSKNGAHRWEKGVFTDTSCKDPLDNLNKALKTLDIATPEGFPRFFGGAVGMIGYDYVRFLENLPDSLPDPLNVDDVAMMICETVVVFDHARNSVKVIALAEPTQAGYEKAQSEINVIIKKLKSPLPELPNKTVPTEQIEPTSNLTQPEFETMVRKVQEYIAAGDGIQMVLSQRFTRASEVHPISAYRAIRQLNPSPFLFLLRFGDFDLVGASPELLVGLEQRKATVRPIAGTRPRGKTELEDKQFAEDLLASEKERAEHIMLVDLGRNDLGRVCEIGTVKPDKIMTIERYSHVMHLVSDVHGKLRGDLNCMDLVRATFPAGTLSGAPKVRAMEIIEELETSRRGAYGGAIGFFCPNGDTELAITIRSITIKDGMAHVQAGAGLVYDSDPTEEYLETLNKAGAPLAALRLAEKGLE
jgi:anthranilate synthase component 1